MILVDLNEPSEIVRLLEQSLPVAVTNLNQTKRSDYLYCGVDGLTRQFSRKQAGELLADIDEAEDQLRDYYNNADENYQIVEGIISPVPLATVSRKQYYAIRSGKMSALDLRGDILRGPMLVGGSNCLYAYKVDDVADKEGEHVHRLSGSIFRVSSSMLFSWLRSLDRVGITTHFTINQEDTARLLVAFYKNDQKEEHSVLKRYIRPRVNITERDPFVKALMGLSWAYGLGIGEEKARALKARYETIYDLNMAEPEEICRCEGIGKITAVKILRALGREDV